MSCDYDSKNHTQPRTNVTQQNITGELMAFRVSKCIIVCYDGAARLHSGSTWVGELPPLLSAQ